MGDKGEKIEDVDLPDAKHRPPIKIDLLARTHFEIHADDRGQKHDGPNQQIDDIFFIFMEIIGHGILVLSLQR